MRQSRFKVCKAVLRLEKADLITWNLIEKSPKYTDLARSASQNPLRRPTMEADIFEDFESTSKKFLATPLPL